LHDFGGNLLKRWYIDYYIDGERQRKWIAAKPVSTRPERAEKELLKIEKKVLKNLSLNTSAVLSSEIYQDNKNISINLFDLVKAIDIKKRTRDTYKSDVKILLKMFPDLDFTALSLKMALQAEYPTGQTAKNKFGSISSLFGHAKRAKLISFNPFEEKISGIKVKGSTNANYPFNEYERSIIEPELKKYPQLYLFTRFIYYSFSRPNEILNLRIGDINLRARTITIKPEFSKPGTLLVKPMVKPFFDLILQSGILNNPNSFYIFGKKLIPSTVKCPNNFPASEHKRVLERLNLYRAYETVPYAWKHTGNINAYLAGMDIKLIQKINGHKSLQTTEIYLKNLGLFLDKQAFDFEF
jgi:integrase